MENSKQHLTDRMELPNQDKIRTLREKETYKYLRILEADTIEQRGMKEQIKKYFRRNRKLLKTKLCCRNLIKGINTWAVHLVRYSRSFIKGPEKNLSKWELCKKLTFYHTNK